MPVSRREDVVDQQHGVVESAMVMTVINAIVTARAPGNVVDPARVADDEDHEQDDLQHRDDPPTG